MDYPFYIKPISQIPDSIIEILAAKALTMDYGVHPHFYSTQPVKAYIGSRDYSCELGQLVKRLLVPLIPMNVSTITMWEVNLLPAGKSIAEHSDIASQNGAQGHLVVKSHKIHIPLITNELCRFLHRRTRVSDKSSCTMPTGYAYAYNNYVWHEVNNGGAEDRYQMTVRYWDPEWADRAALMTRLGINFYDGYEITSV